MSRAPTPKDRAEILASLQRLRARIKQRQALQDADRETEADLLAILRELS